MLTFQPLWAVKAWNDSSYAATAFSSHSRNVSVPLSPPELPPASEPPPSPEPPEPLSCLVPEGEQAAAVPSRPAAAKEERRVRRLSMRRSFRDDELLHYPPSAGRTGVYERRRAPSPCHVSTPRVGTAAQRSVASPTERVICLWNTTISSTSGSIASVVPAITSVQLLLYCDWRAEVATVITCHCGPEVITIGHMKLFQCVTTVISTSVTMIGRFSGTTRCHSSRSVPAPSIRIASISSLGTPRKFSRSRKIAYGEPSTNGS